MARDRLTSAGLDPAATAVIEAYLDRLARRLPAPPRVRARIAAELRDDLIEATTAELPRSADAAAAAYTAVAEFGDVDPIVAAFRPELAARYARRFGLILLATGPLVGAGWAAASFWSATTPAWRWPLLLAIPLVLLGAPAAALTVATTGRLSRRLSPRAATGPQAALAGGTIAGLTAFGGDLILLAGTALVLVTTSVPPPALLGLAAIASLARLGFVSASAAGLKRHLAAPRPEPHT